MKYLFSDLDGTLMLAKDGSVPGVIIPKHNLDAIRNWNYQGNKFGIATGRPHLAVDKINRENNIEDFSVCENGMILSVGEKIVIKGSLDLEDVKISLDHIMKDNIECLGFYGDENIAFYNENVNLESTKKRQNKYKDFYKFIKITEVDPSRVIHLTLLFTSSELKMEYVEKLSKHMKSSKIVPSMKDAADIVNDKVSKLSTILEFAKINNIDHNNIGYVGDGLNDLECLNYFKNSFVMKNSTPELLKQLRNNNAKKVIDVAEAINLFK